MNIVAYFFDVFQQTKSNKTTMRIPEKIVLLLLCGGFISVHLVMKYFCHKT
ncbi:DUF1294 domain-containing protein [Actinobacillus seminis]|uniref:DUF1294 domain-containing protein n=1 Tax=Actinobacillus seminis TaxID=722 RepID=UPI000E1FE8AA|nr:DUF1294 domain-containing protein [Actinobacillus seminis]